MYQKQLYTISCHIHYFSTSTSEKINVNAKTFWMPHGVVKSNISAEGLHFLWCNRYKTSVWDEVLGLTLVRL